MYGSFLQRFDYYVDMHVCIHVCTHTHTASLFQREMHLIFIFVSDFVKFALLHLPSPTQLASVNSCHVSVPVSLGPYQPPGIYSSWSSWI